MSKSETVIGFKPTEVLMREFEIVLPFGASRRKAGFRMRLLKIGMIMAPLAAIVALIVALLFPEAGTPERSAFIAAREAVKRNLRAALTAKFSEQNSLQTGSKRIEDSNEFSVWGIVDSQNDFGVYLRSEWSARVRQLTNGWLVVFLRIGDATLISEDR